MTTKSKNRAPRLPTNSLKIPKKVYAPYLLPFAVFTVITYLGPLLGMSAVYAYPLKTVLVAACLIHFKKDYRREIRIEFKPEAVLSGALVFALWVLSENLYPHNGVSVFSSWGHTGGAAAAVLISFRLAGAVLVVPLMEELFWRSFALRFLISTDFRSVPLESFTWFSFIAVSLAFGFEHHRWLPGILAGLIYALLLYRSKNLFSPILSHAVTNLLLGIYVLITRQWSFW